MYKCTTPLLVNTLERISMAVTNASPNDHHRRFLEELNRVSIEIRGIVLTMVHLLQRLVVISSAFIFYIEGLPSAQGNQNRLHPNIHGVHRNGNVITLTQARTIRGHEHACRVGRVWLQMACQCKS